ncbi:hypothetical protein ACP4OV_007492 [Aristida adscensionis]
MQAAAARARRVLASPAASGLYDAVSTPRLGRAARAEGVPRPCINGAPASASSPRHARSFSSASARNLLLPTMTSQWCNDKSVRCNMPTSHFSTEASDIDHPTEAVEEMYQKMLKSVEARTMPPNAWLWSMIGSCSNKEDIKLLFDILQKLRVFRIANLRINANFNDHLCMKLAEACARVGAFDYGLKALWKHNVYGITPTIGSAHYLLQHAKAHNDTKLTENIMQVLERNSLPLQPGTADIVFSICYNADRWDLLSKYAERFVKAGVKLHRTAFDIWMEFAAKVGKKFDPSYHLSKSDSRLSLKSAMLKHIALDHRELLKDGLTIDMFHFLFQVACLGDSQSIWNINSLRGRSVKQYTLATGFACAKGFLLERKPESAAAIIKLLHKHLPDQKKPFVKDELQKLIAEWPTEVIKRQKKDNRKALEEALIKDIPTMTNCLTKSGLDFPVDLDKLTPQQQAA